MLAAPCLGCSTLPSAEPRCHTYLRWMQRFETNLGSAVSWEECSVAAVTELGGVLCCSGHDGVRIRTHSVVCLILGTRTNPSCAYVGKVAGPGRTLLANTAEIHRFCLWRRSLSCIPQLVHSEHSATSSSRTFKRALPDHD